MNSIPDRFRSLVIPPGARRQSHASSAHQGDDKSLHLEELRAALADRASSSEVTERQAPPPYLWNRFRRRSHDRSRRGNRLPRDQREDGDEGGCILHAYPGTTATAIAQSDTTTKLAQVLRPTGKAYGLDMTDEMLALANENKRKAGADNVEFLKGEIEHIPLPDNSV